MVATEGAIDSGGVIILIDRRGALSGTTWLLCTSEGIEFRAVVGTEGAIDLGRVIEFTGRRGAIGRTT